MPCQLGLDTAGSLALRDRNEMTAAPQGKRTGELV